MTLIGQGTAEVNWHVLSVDDVVARVGVDAERGLDADEVQRRLAEFGRNEVASLVAPAFTAIDKAIRLRRLDTSAHDALSQPVTG